MANNVYPIIVTSFVCGENINHRPVGATGPVFADGPLHAAMLSQHKGLGTDAGVRPARHGAIEEVVVATVIVVPLRLGPTGHQEALVVTGETFIVPVFSDRADRPWSIQAEVQVVRVPAPIVTAEVFEDAVIARDARTAARSHCRHRLR